MTPTSTPVYAQRMAQPRAVLTDREIRAAQPAEKEWKLTDGNGLYVLVKPSGSKLWQWKYHYGGRERKLSIGVYPVVSLKAAREARDAGRARLAVGVDPGAEKKTLRQAKVTAVENSFKRVAADWWALWSKGKSERHAAQVMRRLENDVFPRIGTRPVSKIEAPELVAMLTEIQGRGASDLAKRSLQMTNQVMRYAVAHSLASRNPGADIRPADVLASVPKKNQARVDASELPTLLRKIDGYHGAPVTRYAMKLMAMTFVRTTELIGARWEEIDLDGARWTIPAERMKMKKPHIVPLSTQAVEVLMALYEITGGNALLFPGERDHAKPMSNNTILKALERMGYKGKMTGHGFRGIASTILHEQNKDHAHIELQLAHVERNAVSAAYNHATYLPQRAEMMQQWSDYLASLTKPIVVRLVRKRA